MASRSIAATGRRLAKHCDFPEVSYLLLGKLPDEEEKNSLLATSPITRWCTNNHKFYDVSAAMHIQWRSCVVVGALSAYHDQRIYPIRATAWSRLTA